jgi:hypothetical protein
MQSFGDIFTSAELHAQIRRCLSRMKRNGGDEVRLAEARATVDK